MRVFVVLASLVVLISADVKHLYDAPYRTQTTVNHGVPLSGYGTVSQSSFSAPVVNFVKTSSPVQHNYIKPNIVTVDKYEGPSSLSGGYVQQPADFIQQHHTTVQYQPSAQVSGNRFGNEQSFSGSNTGYTTTSFGNSGSGNLGYNGAVNSGFQGNFQDSASSGHQSYQHTTFVKQTAPIVTKSSYVFAAPEDKEDLQRDQTIVLPRPRQHYKVVFIKAPSTTIVNTPSAAVGGQTQEKTLIYVLSDKKRIENHIDVPEIDQVKPQKPEVFFVKYNKPTEVINSQIKYETVDAINGAENGAVNGVANKVSGNGQLSDEGSSPEQAQIAQAIYESVRNGGLQSGIQTVNQLVSAGHSISNFGGANRGQFDTIANVEQPTNSYTSSQKTSYSAGVAPASYVTEQKQATVSYGSGNSAINGASYPEQGYNY